MEAEKKRKRMLFAGCLIVVAAGAVLRFFRLGAIPFGLQQDEASIGYDALCLVRWGIDRNGYPWPVYPISWGSGGGSPLLDYLAVLSTALLGKSPFSLRFFPALLGSLTAPVLALLAVVPAGNRSFGDPPSKPENRCLLALILSALTVFNPWHIMLSRWSLDSNTLPFFMASAILLFALACSGRKHSTASALSSAAVFALCVYAYGSATVIIPVVLLIAAVFAVRAGYLSIRQILLSALVFTLVLVPLLVFFLFNLLGLPPLVTPFFSVPRLVAGRSMFYLGRDFFTHLGGNLRYLLLLLTIGVEQGEQFCNVIPGYAQMYRFTFPLTFAGIFISIRAVRSRKSMVDLLFLATAFVSLLFTLFIEPDINRVTPLLLPLLYFQGLGLVHLIRKIRPAGLIAAAAILIASLLFVRDYFGTRFRDLSRETFMPGYLEAAERAGELAGPGGRILSTQTQLAAPFMLALYATETPPEIFLSTVEWKDENAEFRIARAFDRFSFGLPEDTEEIDLDHTVLILHTGELDSYPEISSENAEIYGDFAVIAP